MPTLREQNEQLSILKKRLAVWEAIYSLTDEKFISKDGRKVSGIKVPGADEIVPEEMIEEVLQSISDEAITKLLEEIDAIENQQVIVIGESKGSA